MILVLFSAGPGCRDGECPRWVSEQRTVYKGIPAGIKFLCPEGADARAIANQAWTLIEDVGRVADPFEPASELGRLNATRKVGPVRVSGHLWNMLRLSKEVYDATGGAFDPTVWPLEAAYRSAASEGHLPSPRRLREARARVGMEKVRLLPPDRVVFEKPYAQLDLGGIAKGYAVDLVADFLRQQGVRHYLVQIGGETACSGVAPRGKAWAVGISDPRNQDNALAVATNTRGMSLSTSGPYERPTVVHNRLLNHVFEPHTGTPAPLTVLSVSVAFPSPEPHTALADALATALVVVGPGGAEDAARRFGAHVLMVTRTGVTGSLRLRVYPDTRGVFRLSRERRHPGIRPPGPATKGTP